MSNHQNNTNPKDDSAQDLNQHGLRDIVPPDEEYYTIDPTRGRSRPTENDIDPVDIASTDPYENLDTEDPETAMPHSSADVSGVVSQRTDNQPTSSNDGGPVPQKDIVDQNNEQGVAVGESGDSRVDAGTG